MLLRIYKEDSHLAKIYKEAKVKGYTFFEWCDDEPSITSEWIELEVYE